MKKIIYTLAGIAVTATLMVGCGTTATTPTTATPATTDQSNKTASTEDGSNKPADFQKADLEGEVASIDGNKITVKVVKMPEAPAGGTEGGNPKDATQNGDKANTQDDSKDGQTPKTSEKMQVEYTGDNKVITVADGTKISTMSGEPQSSDSKDLAISDVKVGDTLQITYSDKTNETISNIIVRSAESQNGNANTK